jgi:hypothetical protein
MLAALDQHCRPDTVANAFTTLMSLFNDVQGNSEPIMEFCSCFDGMVMDMTRCKNVIPPILLVMFFLCDFHGRYTDLLKQFCSRLKVLEELLLTLWSKMSVTMTVSPWLVLKSLLPLRGLKSPKLLLLMPLSTATSGTILLSGLQVIPRRELRLTGLALWPVWASAQFVTMPRNLGMFQQTVPSLRN